MIMKYLLDKSKNFDLLDQIFSRDILYGNYWAFILFFPFKKAMVCLLIDSIV
jgi:hypothetical protein